VVLLQLGLHGSFDLRRLALAEFRATHAEIGLRVLQPAGLHELIEGKVDCSSAASPATTRAIVATA